MKYADHEKQMLEVIDQRDCAEEALSQAYFLVTGKSPEWSNLFGHNEALQDIDDAQATLRKTVAELEVQLKEAIEERDLLNSHLGENCAALSETRKLLAQPRNVVVECRDCGGFTSVILPAALNEAKK